MNFAVACFGLAEPRGRSRNAVPENTPRTRLCEQFCSDPTMRVCNLCRPSPPRPRQLSVTESVALPPDDRKGPLHGLRPQFSYCGDRIWNAPSGADDRCPVREVSRAVIVHAIDQSAMSFYLKHGFIEFPSGSKTMFMPIETLEKGLS